MNRLSRELQEQLDEIYKICNQAIQDQLNRQRTLGYGLDDYTEGRIVGAANMARKIKRIVFKEEI
jgi:predicted transcriptional regulator